MPTVDEVKDQIREAAEEAGLNHGSLPDSEMLVVKVPAGERDERFGIVAVTCRKLGEDNVIVLLVAPAVSGSSLLDDGALGDVQEVVNGLNENALFGRWVFHEDDRRVDLEHELVGDNLSSDGIRLILEAMGRGASDLEGFFMKAFPGCEPGMSSRPDFKVEEIDWA